MFAVLMFAVCCFAVKCLLYVVVLSFFVAALYNRWKPCHDLMDALYFLKTFTSQHPIKNPRSIINV